MTARHGELESAAEQIDNGSSGGSSVAHRCVDGKCFPTVVFTSGATNLVGNDTNLPISSSREPNRADDNELVLLEVGELLQAR